MATKFKVEVLTPEGKVFDDEVERISTRTETGSIGILAGHQPLLGLLAPSDLKLYRTESDVVIYAQGEGYVQVSRDGVLFLVEDAIEPGELDASDLQSKLRRAEEALASAEEGSEAQSAARRDRRRWEAFLRVAESR
jgi:F-type H+-transporting ATPase subunit epsilon